RICYPTPQYGPEQKRIKRGSGQPLPLIRQYVARLSDTRRDAIIRFWRPVLYQLSYTPSFPGLLHPDRASAYFRILATTPAPTVRPPSRIAKRKPSSIAIGTNSSTSIVMLSPGITIPVPSGNVTVPVTSVVPQQNCGR